MEYFASGYAFRKRRLWDSLKANLKFYISCAVIIVVVAIIVLTTSNERISDAPSITLAVANIYGLLLILLLLGYGLVEVPRKLWRSADPVTETQRLQYYAVDVDAVFFDAKCDLEDAMHEAREAANKVVSAVSEEHIIAESVLTLCDECQTLMSTYSSSSNISEEGKKKGRRSTLGSQGLQGKAKERGRHSATDTVTRDELAQTHARLKAAKALFVKASWKWRSLVENSVYFDLIFSARRRQTAPVENDGVDADVDVVDEIDVETVLLENDASNRFWKMWNRFIAWWHFKFSFFWYRGWAIVSMILSIIVLWCEVSIPLNSALGANISVLGLIVNGTKDAVGKHLLALIPLAYICICVYFSLFRINLFATVELAGRHHTDAYR